ncbi:SRPBCC domain-containing protein [Chitinophaga niabensis]|uniref:Uncharacterized conserved protein YndB, AHSA1/START domain n=1 Tax=Chitinophaga niabensis TaxID=536979 RepID=A0A1N6K307_9BACT|nr:SRPBCC domain-containing protein [Chitinophaga niabensis]SIO50939.1 Uncharacterized conserved protein YndB, AHSA1/START domain [Chitinophaga niabensis]
MENITVNILVHAPLAEVWKYWTEPSHILNWNQPSEDWHTSRVENDLRVGGSFLYVMEAKDGSGGFDFTGVYDVVDHHREISYTLTDGRTATNIFTQTETGTTITETFEPEKGQPAKDQELFCTAILECFKKYVEGLL